MCKTPEVRRDELEEKQGACVGKRRVGGSQGRALQVTLAFVGSILAFIQSEMGIIQDSHQKRGIT